MMAVAKLHQNATPGAAVATALLDWYDKARRELPWRAHPGHPTDAYAVWLSEVMLQQTTVKAVVPYYKKFLNLWPTVGELAQAPREEVMRAWAGLGYYSRARNLHLCAKTVVERHGGRFPASVAELLELPGIGPYTAAAVAAIAFDQPAMPVDGNVERVMARLHAVETPLPQAKPELKKLAEQLIPERRAGDLAQALMDLGATVCAPRRPSCMLCPLESRCRANASGLAAELPYRRPKAERPVRRGVAFLALSESGEVLLRRRPDDGLLAQMMEIPSTDWTDAWLAEDEALRSAPVKAAWWPVPGIVTHTFTHFRLELLVYRALVPSGGPLTLWAEQDRCRWVPRHELGREALPSVMRKAIAHALDGAS
ncbi:MAG: A/G-specific adenine glycosylase [Hyphomicrobiaceae bacterium]